MQNNIALIVPKHAVKEETSFIKVLKSYKEYTNKLNDEINSLQVFKKK